MGYDGGWMDGKDGRMVMVALLDDHAGYEA